ncbi:MAG: NADH-quinone oxidoreductase subunit C [Gracilimonas sp.]|nr:NADH-quinone oxidoreductase subunit C [Gracilimonas sp.]
MKEPKEIFEYLIKEFGEDGIHFETGDTGEPWIEVPAGNVKEIMKFLRDDFQLKFNVLMCLSGVHYASEAALGVTYHINSTVNSAKLALKVKVPEEDPVIPSVESIWKTANWHEREAYDMVGIHFKNHPDLRRILTAEDWEGHPLRKDYVQQEFYQGIPTGE